MKSFTVSIVKYDRPLDSVRRAVDLSQGLAHLSTKAKVLIKPNIVFWTKSAPFPKYGVITTSRVVEDMVVLLKDEGIDDITIGEGIVIRKPGDNETPAHAFETLGYNLLKKRYGVKSINFYERPFETTDIGDGLTLNFNKDAMESDFIVNLPVMKTHAQTMVSLGIKNLKGAIDVDSRKKCHNADPGRDLNFMVARLADKMPPIFTLLDGIYTNERGPGFEGRMHRTNILVGSADVFSADLVGAKILGFDPSHVPHLCYAAKNRKRPMDLSDIKVVGERVEDVASKYAYKFHFNKSGNLPLPMEKMGIKGLSVIETDLTICTYCAGLVMDVILRAIARSWTGQPFDDVEILTGKVMKPTPGMKKTILLGKCMFEANKDNPDINEAIPVKGCPPQPTAMGKALKKAGFEIDSRAFEKFDEAPGRFMKRYEGNPEFEEAHFKVVQEAVRE